MLRLIVLVGECGRSGAAWLDLVGAGESKADDGPVDALRCRSSYVPCSVGGDLIDA